MTTTKITIAAHQGKVRMLLCDCIGDLWKRYLDHDKSKLMEPEFSVFDRHISRLSKTEYGSQEYFDELKAMDPAIQHHYLVNRHHPEHFVNGVDDMILVDLLEMLCDWIAAAQNGPNGSFKNSLTINTKRFRLSDQLVRIFENTAKWLEDAAKKPRRYVSDYTGGAHAESKTQAS